MTELGDIREGLAINLAVIEDTQVSAYMLNELFAPAIEVVPGKTEYDQSFRRGIDRWVLRIRAFTGMPSDIGAQKNLDLMLASAGAKSVKAAIESDSTLGGVAAGLRVTQCTGYRVFERPGSGAMLGAEWEVEVWAEGA